MATMIIHDAEVINQLDALVELARTWYTAAVVARRDVLATKIKQLDRQATTNPTPANIAALYAAQAELKRQPPPASHAVGRRPVLAALLQLANPEQVAAAVSKHLKPLGRPRNPTTADLLTAGVLTAAKR